MGLLAALFLLSGCSKESRPTYTYYQEMPREGWDAATEVFYTFPVGAGMQYLLEGGLRVTPDFLLQEIPLGVVIESPSHRYEEYQLTVPVDRQPISIRGYVVREVPFVVREDFVPRDSGDYTVSFRSLLRDSVVDGVLEVGLTVTPIGDR